MALFETGSALAGIDAFLVLPVDSSGWFRIAVETAVALTTNPANWESVGGVSPDSAAQSASATYLDLFYMPDPTGMIQAYAGPAGTVPGGALLCDGSLYLTTDFPQLFGVIGYMYGGSGSHFAVPNLGSRVIAGFGGSFGGSPTTVGQSGGEEKHTLITGELASHTHTDSGHSHTESAAAPTTILVGAGAPAPSAVPSASVTGSSSANIQSSGSDQPHNNLQPYLVLQYVILTGLPG